MKHPLQSREQIAGRQTLTGSGLPLVTVKDVRDNTGQCATDRLLTTVIHVAVALIKRAESRERLINCCTQVLQLESQVVGRIRLP